MTDNKAISGYESVYTKQFRDRCKEIFNEFNSECGEGTSDVQNIVSAIVLNTRMLTLLGEYLINFNLE